MRGQRNADMKRKRASKNDGEKIMNSQPKTKIEANHPIAEKLKEKKSKTKYHKRKLNNTVSDPCKQEIEFESAIIFHP
jgi:hypothetical protein